MVMNATYTVAADVLRCLSHGYGAHPLEHSIAETECHLSIVGLIGNGG